LREEDPEPVAASQPVATQPLWAVLARVGEDPRSNAQNLDPPTRSDRQEEDDGALGHPTALSVYSGVPISIWRRRCDACGGRHGVTKRRWQT